MPTVTLKVSDETRALWQRMADRDAAGNLSEWLRSIADQHAVTTAKLSAATGGVRPAEPTVVAARPLPPERLAAGHVRPFRGPDTKGQPLRRDP